MRVINWATSVVKNRSRAVPRPAWCTYIVTFRCNARCQMCDSWQMEPGEELDVAQVRDVFSKIGRLDIVRLSGGEPFMRTDLPQIAEAVLAASRPGIIHITTNGSYRKRVEAFIREFPQPSRLRFMVSFDGLEEEHDANRGAGVPFRRAVDTVQTIAEMRESHGVEVSANHTVISPQSLADNEGLRNRLAEWDVDVHSVLAYAESSMYGLSLHGQSADHLIVPKGYPLHPKLDGADVVGFVERELERAGDMRNFMLRWGKRYYLKGLLSRLTNGQEPKPNPKCVALRSHIRILPDGSVPVCQFNTEKVGNLRDQSFDEVWHSEPTSGARDWVDGCPGCWAECEVMPNAIFSGDILKPQ